MTNANASGTWTVVEASTRLSEVIERAHPRDPHYYLAVLGTDPDEQGRGIGSALIQPVLETCDRDEVPAYLESSKERNIDFYARHGFRVTDELVLPDMLPHDSFRRLRVLLRYGRPAVAGAMSEEDAA